MKIPVGFVVSELFLLWLYLLSLSLKPAQCGHIVGFAALDYVSHNRVLWKLGKELQSRGHKYTQILPSCAKESFNDIEVKVFHTSVTSTDIEKCARDLAEVGNFNSISGMFKFIISIQRSSEYVTISRRFCEDFLANETLITELKQSVDAVLCDIINNCCSILADMLNVTRIDVSTIGFAGPVGAHIFQNPLAPIYLTLESSFGSLEQNKFSFANRLVNFIIYTSYSRYESALQGRRTHGVSLISHDFALGFARPLAANVKLIGPVTAAPARKLPDYLNEFMAKNDKVVLVSFSTVFSKYNPDFMKVIAEGLSKVSVAVLWKHSGDVPSNVGKNTKIVQWIPQNDILGHPSTKVFVTHGGLNSFQETVYHSVPMIVIPLFGDQYQQAGIAKHKGIGISLDRNFMTANDLAEAINEVLNNRLYGENIKKISALIKDRRQTPSEEGADWIEYALRHDGAPHLVSEALDLPEYQLYMFDVVLFLSVVVIIFLFVFVRLCCCICRSKTKYSVKEKQT